MKCIRIYRWEDAPKDFKKLPDTLGDEDWVIVIPRNFNYEDDYIPGNLDMVLDPKENYATGWGGLDRHTLKNGDMVVIVSHA